MMLLLCLAMANTRTRENNPKKRHLITKGEWPESAGGGKSSTKEKIVFIFIVIVTIIIIFVIYNLLNW